MELHFIAFLCLKITLVKRGVRGIETIYYQRIERGYHSKEVPYVDGGQIGTDNQRGKST